MPRDCLAFVCFYFLCHMCFARAQGPKCSLVLLRYCFAEFYSEVFVWYRRGCWIVLIQTQIRKIAYIWELTEPLLWSKQSIFNGDEQFWKCFCTFCLSNSHQGHITAYKCPSTWRGCKVRCNLSFKFVKSRCLHIGSRTSWKVQFYFIQYKFVDSKISTTVRLHF